MLDIEKLYNTLLDRKFKDINKAQHYLKRYCRFIEQRANRNLVYHASLNGIEKHHIIPQKWGGTDDPSNLMVLTIAEHVVAHHILARTTNSQMIYAFNQIANRSINSFNYNVSLKLVAEARREYLKLICKPVVNLSTGVVYSSATEASKVYGFRTSSVGCACRKHFKIGGCYWAYVADMQSVDTEACQQRIKEYVDAYQNIKRYYSNRRKKRVIELDTGKIYESAIAAAEQYGVVREIITTAARLHKSARGHRWAYIDDYPDYTIDDFRRMNAEIAQRNHQTKIDNSVCRPVINLNTGKVYYSICEACRQIGVQTRALQNSIKKRYKCCGSYWEYYVDDIDCEQMLKHIAEEIENNRLNAKRKNSHGRRLINLDTGEVVASKQELARRYQISADRINYAALNYKLLLNQHAWQYIDQLPNTKLITLNALRKQYV